MQNVESLIVFTGKTIRYNFTVFASGTTTNHIALGTGTGKVKLYDLEKF